MLKVRKQHPGFGTGTFVPLEADNESVLAFLRVTDEETLLCVTNLASTARSARITVPGRAGALLTDVFGGAPLGSTGADGDVVVTLGSRDFYWLTVTTPDGPPATE